MKFAGYAPEGVDTINDDNPLSFARVGRDPAEADAWFAVKLPAPARISRIVFVQGFPGRHGGWFDASVSRPRIQIRRAAGGAWESVGELDGYPAATARHPAGLHLGRHFELRLPDAVPAAAVRVIGAPALVDPSGPPAAWCAELQAY